MFATASFLWIKDGILKGKPGSGNDLTVPPLFETDFTPIQTLLRSNHSVDGSIYGVSEHVAFQLTVQSRGPSGSRRSNWATVGTSSARTSRTPRSSAISKVVLNPLANRWSDPSLIIARLKNYRLGPSQCTHVDILSSTDLFSPQMQYMSRSLVQALLCKCASLWIFLRP